MRPVFERLQTLGIPAEGMKIDEILGRTTDDLGDVITRRAAEIRRAWGVEASSNSKGEA